MAKHNPFRKSSHDQISEIDASSYGYNNAVKEELNEQVFDYEQSESHYLDEHPELSIIRWQGPEYEVYPKSSLWYAVAVFITLAVAVFSVWNNAPIPAFLAVLIGAVGYLYLNSTPRVVEFAVTYEGIVADDQLHLYESIESFWIIYEEPHTRVISLKIKDGFFVHTHIPLHQVDPVEVREAMLQFIPERRQEPTLVDTIERLLHI